jgi:hypothetical protein
MFALFAKAKNVANVAPRTRVLSQMIRAARRRSRLARVKQRALRFRATPTAMRWLLSPDFERNGRVAVIFRTRRFHHLTASPACRLRRMGTPDG